MHLFDRRLFDGERIAISCDEGDPGRSDRIEVREISRSRTNCFGAREDGVESVVVVSIRAFPPEISVGQLGVQFADGTIGYR